MFIHFGNFSKCPESRHCSISVSLPASCTTAGAYPIHAQPAAFSWFSTMLIRKRKRSPLTASLLLFRTWTFQRNFKRKLFPFLGLYSVCLLICIFLPGNSFHLSLSFFMWNLYTVLRLLETSIFTGCFWDILPVLQSISDMSVILPTVLFPLGAFWAKPHWWPKSFAVFAKACWPLKFFYVYFNTYLDMSRWVS
jgi:hypothetical protein